MFLGFFRIGPIEALLIVAIIVLIFGTSRFGKLKSSVTKAVNNLKQSAKGNAEE